VDQGVPGTAAGAVTAGQRAGAGEPLAGADQDQDQDQDAADGLIQLSRLVQGVFARTAERHDLTPVQARLLCVLAFGPRGMADLAQCFGVEKAALTGLVDRAEGRGLVRRSSVPGDRRAVRVTLTDAGRSTASAFHAAVTEGLSHLLAPLAPHDREHFRSAMAAIIATSGPASPGPGGGGC
jgi:DNA-binding MarR family transcriptional regulator